MMSKPLTMVPARSVATDAVLDIRGLCVDYGVGDNAVRAVRDVSLTLRRGEVLGLAGESGSGKSTLAYGLARLLPPPGVVSGGEVIYNPPDGEPVDVLALSPSALRSFRWAETSIVFQGAMNSLNPVHKVSTQLMDVLAAHRTGMSRRAMRDRARELLVMVGIAPDRLDAYPHQLSGGMRQRVMIGMALALEPKIVIMDEPTTALDVVMQRQILRQIVELRERFGFSVLFITHDLSLLSSSPTGSPSCTAAASSRRRRPPCSAATRCTPTATACCTRSPRCGGRAGSWPGSPAHRRTCRRCRPVAPSIPVARGDSSRATARCRCWACRPVRSAATARWPAGCTPRVPDQGEM